MPRHLDWLKRLHDVIARHQALPASFGISDCFVIADDSVEAVTGRRMFPDARGYTTPAGAAKQLRRHGFASLREAFASKFQEVPVLMAQRGDIGVYDNDGEISGGVFTAVGFMTRGAEEIVFLPPSAALAAFRVE
ncbi:DUF6950 family protein [Shinella zoogloeoides]|uniref:DUF6950 family protein n=1 Tax=Shinella zoogloeoides TaxID=352475 RepID=UPI00299EF3A0|nr:hypothetical protein [Shinella zoogloeoides]WPE19968.1 hypothetical protein ShzoTeo12_11480 [Shinella zoogloeoides]